MSSRKRAAEAMEKTREDAQGDFLSQLRNMWEFANLGQWIYLFGKAAKIDNAIDIDELEMECLKPSSTVLDDIALAILKLVSSHRGLTQSIFDDQARKQYLAFAPSRNPFGDGEDPHKFSEFDVLTKIRVMQQLAQWTMRHPERIREKMDEQRDIEQTDWRIEPYGWDSKDRTYFVLDDNRVYRMTEAPQAPPTSARKKASSRSKRQSSKRRRVTRDEPNTSDDEDANEPASIDNGLGGNTWECVAVTLGEVQSLLQSFKKSRDKNEEILKRQLQDHLLPILEKQEEARKRKEIQRERELLNLAKMANAKRSSRIAGKVERQKQEESAREEEERIKAAEVARRREEEKQSKLEQDRDSRLASREKRLKEREARRVQHEEELAALSEDAMSTTSGKGRISERQRQAEISKNREALKELEDEEEDWVFDCVCGMFGHIDDGTHSVACESCNVWQHSKCLGISEQEAERPDFHFVCKPCTSKQDSATRPKMTIKLKVNHADIDADAHDSTMPQDSSAVGGDQKPKSTLRVELPAGLPLSAQTDVPVPSTPHPGEHTNGTGHAVMAPRVDKPEETHQAPSAQAGVEQSISIVHTRPEGTVATKALGGSMMTPSPILSKRQIEPLVSPLMTSEKLHHGVVSSGGTDSVVANQQGTPRMENYGFPTRAGISPTKQSPRPMSPANTSFTGSAPGVLPPITLSPTSREVILTPPVKSSSPPRPVLKEA